MIQIYNVHKSYWKKKVLEGVDLTVPERSSFALLGVNGSGKTTLVYIIAGLLKPDSGRVLISGSPATTREAKGSRVVLFQGRSLDPKLTVYENIELFVQLYGGGDPEVYIERFDLTNYRGEIVKNLSGGLKKRVEIARTLSVDVENIIMDEPSLGLDQKAREILVSEIKALSKRKSIFIATNNMEIAQACSQVGILHGGKIILQGEPEALVATLPEKAIRITAKSRNVLSAVSDFIHAKVKNMVVVLSDDEEPVIRKLRKVENQIESIEIKRTSLAELFLIKTGRFIERERRSGERGA